MKKILSLPLILLISLLPILNTPIASSQEEKGPLVYSGIIIVSMETEGAESILGAFPITVTYWIDRGIVEVDSTTLQPRLIGQVKSMLRQAFKPVSATGNKAPVDIVYLTLDSKDLYLCREAVRIEASNGVIYLDPDNWLPVLIRYKTSQLQHTYPPAVVSYQLELSLAASPIPICGDKITTWPKMMFIAGTSITIILGALYTFTSWRKELSEAWII